MDLITYAILNKKIKTAATGISDIYKDGDEIVFVMADGSEFRIADETKDIIDVDIDDDRYIVITYVDGSTTKSDEPIPYPLTMTGSTQTVDGISGLVPTPTKGDIGYLNNRGEWDKNIAQSVENLENAVPTDDIPDGATLAADGWKITTDEEVADEFAKWED